MAQDMFYSALEIGSDIKVVEGREFRYCTSKSRTRISGVVGIG